MSVNPTYDTFLKSKIKLFEPRGFLTDRGLYHPSLKPHQRDIVSWACNKGCALIAASFGLGKTRMNIQILLEMKRRSPHAPVLVICPLGVRQEFTQNDGPVMGVTFQYIRNRDEQHAATSDFHITNYERVRDGDLDLSLYECVCLDEGSVLRSIGSDTTQKFLKIFKFTPYKFVFTATPSPNDYIEILYYAEFLGVMDRGQSKTRFFSRNSEKADDLTLDPKHEDDFWLWVSSWAVFINKPSDLGYSDEGYALPPLNVHWHEVKIPASKFGIITNREGQVSAFADVASSLQDAALVKRVSMDDRLEKVKSIIDEHPERHWLIWHHLEDERRAIEKLIPDVISVYGTQKLDEREQAIIDFSTGKIKNLSSKPDVAGSGCNFQRHCHSAVYAGIDYKFNGFIQSAHRIYRFLQEHACDLHIVYTEEERHIMETLQEKWNNHIHQMEMMTEIIRKYGLAVNIIEKVTRTFGCERSEIRGDSFTAVYNDSVLETPRLATNSVGLIHTSIPFSIQYEYAQSYNDFGHNSTNEDFFQQMDYIIPELLRVLEPGRICAVHVKDRIVPGNFSGLGFCTVYEFSDDTIKAFKKHGFEYGGRNTVVTDVVRENNGSYRLGWSEVCKDGTKMGFGLPEYVLIFRKPPSDLSNAYADAPVIKTKKNYTRARWQIDAHGHWRSSGNRLLTPVEIARLDIKQAMYYFNNWSFNEVYDYENHVAVAEAMEANRKLPTKFMAVAPQSPHPDVWTDITRMRTLNTMQGQRREQQHLCPLPFDIVERVINRYSNPGDLVLDPFGGLMTVPLVAIKMGRIGYGIDLNKEYFQLGAGYCAEHERKQKVPQLFETLNIRKA